MGGSPPRPWALPTEALSPCPLGMSPRPLSHLGCPGVLGRGGGGSSKEGAARPLSPQPLGPNPSPNFAQAPVGEAVGPGFGPSPSAKNSSLGFVESPWGGGGRSRAAVLWQGGGSPGRKCPGAQGAPQQRLWSVGTAPWKVPGSAFRAA